MTRKATILESGSKTVVEQVGDDLWLDKSTKEIYKTSELRFDDDINDGARKLTNSIIDSIMESVNDDIREQKNRFYDFRTDLVLTILNRRPFIKPDKLEKLIDKITKITLK